MAHHHRRPEHPRVEMNEPGDFEAHAATSTTPAANDAKKIQETPPLKNGKSLFDYQIAGFPWPFVVILSILAIGVIGIVLGVLGVL